MSEPIDIGAYCRAVEDHLTRANGGHLVRILGPGFELVRQWAADGIPLSVVFHAIDAKVERHEAGRATRPLRIEFCETDVRVTFERWRRAVGLPMRAPAADDSGLPVEQETPARRPSLSKHLDRAIDRLSRAAGRLDLPEQLRDAIPEWIGDLTALRDAAKGARGAVRDEIAARVAPVDRIIGDVARSAAPAGLLDEVTADAERDLAPFRGRLRADEKQQALDATVDRLLRGRFGLPIVSDE